MLRIFYPANKINWHWSNECFSRCVLHSRHLVTVATNLLCLASIMSGPFSLDVYDIDLNTLISDNLIIQQLDGVQCLCSLLGIRDGKKTWNLNLGTPNKSRTPFPQEARVKQTMLQCWFLKKLSVSKSNMMLRPSIAYILFPTCLSMYQANYLQSYEIGKE